MGKREEEIVKSVSDKFKQKIIETKIPRDRRVFIVVDRENNTEVIKYLKEKEGFIHCATITPYDAGTHLEAIYHLFDNKSIVCTVTARIPKNDPTIESVTPFLPAANLYEREMFDLIGVIAKNHPNLKRLVLPDEYPHDLHPLLKDAKVEIFEKN